MQTAYEFYYRYIAKTSLLGAMVPEPSEASSALEAGPIAPFHAVMDIDVR